MQTSEEKVYVAPAPKPVYEACKRVFDIVMCTFALIVLSPVLLVVAIAIRSNDGGPAIYKQTRLTKNGKEFDILKFRSMCTNADQMLDDLMDQNEMEGPAFKIKDDPRITRFGKFIRKTSIDELPQLINVLVGDMSLVGPRPPLPREVNEYTDHQRQRLSITPGLTCYWQIQPKRNSLTFDEWLELDLKYIRERSFKTDVVILFKTAAAVCGLEGE